MAPRNTRVSPQTEVRSPARSFLSSLDNFYSPARDTRKEQAFQQGINSFSGIVDQQAARAKQTRNGAEAQQGVADALREQAGEEMKGIRTGSIFRQNSQFYMAGLNETRGKASAARFKAETTQAYQDWEGRHVDDDGVGFRDWMNSRVGDFMGTLGDDQYKIAGAMPIINEVANNFAAQHTGFTANRLETESFEAYDEIVSGVFSDLANGEFDMDEAVSRITDEANDMYETDGAEANNRVVEAAIRYANIHNDPDSILALARAHDSGSLMISQSNREKLANAMDAVEADIMRQGTRANAADTAAQKATKDATLDAWAKALEENPYAEMPTTNDVGDAATRRSMMTFQEAAMKSHGVENPMVSAQNRMLLEVDLFEAGSTQDKLMVLTDFVKANPEGLSGAEFTRYSQNILEQARPDALVKNTQVINRRKNFGQSLGTLQLGDGYSDSVGSTLRVRGEIAFNEYMSTQGREVNQADPVAMNQLMVAAEAHAMQTLAYEFPTLLGDKSEENPDLARAIGADDAVANQQAVVAQAALDAFTVMSGGVVEVTETPETPAIPDVPLEEQPTPFDDADSEEPYSATREGFYGELINRFTDGVDERVPAASAAQVLLANPEFSARVDQLAGKYGVNPMALVAIMDFETGGTFGTDTVNGAGSGATGLIQFMPKTARSLGTSVEELSQMTQVEQMDYVEAYFDQFGSKIQGGQVDDLYMAVLWPAAIGKPSGYPLFQQGTTAYTQNAGLDTNGDGTITKFEAAAKVKAHFNGY